MRILLIGTAVVAIIGAAIVTLAPRCGGAFVPQTTIANMLVSGCPN